ncbi:CRISPR-associated endonuclease Cas1 [Cyclobacterium sp. 1_MG-2023]|uniref:CRISPR-associated endonuclease Cas1 n=1 Tax=Cyclobacterium sp. 1_MG-2023 TaxID=3062681 RepID=UPI0026E342FA|nr:CRISPR-associated endonuclease Cas1 [Cyclobacterium sp. 1_MG-2023]MDO6437060.1 CRISPR-associated endonuclease Cas1 [Cyclobacterium sp. 1_MG-2023]
MQVFINTFGTYLHVKDDMFEIKVKEDKTKPAKISHIAAHKITSFIISKGSAITTDAIALALRHNIDIVVVERDGHPMGRFWHSKLGSTTKIRKRQLQVSMDEEGLKFVKGWLITKLENQTDFLNDLKKNRPALQEKLEQRVCSILELRTKIGKVEGGSVNAVADSIRGWEGSAGRHYFEALSLCIPATFSFKGRSFRPAKDPFNAMLNYAYGILYSRVERGLMLAGLDPYVGFMHRDDYNTKSLVFDCIEPYRIYAERFVFRLFSGKKIKKSFFDEFKGAVSLNTEGKAFFVSPYLEYLDSERIRYAGKNQTRMNALQMEAHKFANLLIEKSNEN